MTACVDLILDTVAPVLTVTAERAAVPPVDWVVTALADEPIGWTTAALTDPSGRVLAVLGTEVLDRRVRVAVPMIAVPGGQMLLRLEVADEVGNLAVVAVPVQVQRPNPFDVALSVDPAYGVAVEVQRAYEAVLDLDPAYDAQVFLLDAYDLTLDLLPGFEATLTITPEA